MTLEGLYVKYPCEQRVNETERRREQTSRHLYTQLITGKQEAQGISREKSVKGYKTEH